MPPKPSRETERKRAEKAEAELEICKKGVIQLQKLYSVLAMKYELWGGPVEKDNSRGINYWIVPNSKPRDLVVGAWQWLDSKQIGDIHYGLETHGYDETMELTDSAIGIVVLLPPKKQGKNDAT